MNKKPDDEDDFLAAHARGDHQAEIVAIMEKIEIGLHGHRRDICCFALTRMLAAMLGPAKQSTRDAFIAEIPPMLHGILTKMDVLSGRIHRA